MEQYMLKVLLFSLLGLCVMTGFAGDRVPLRGWVMQTKEITVSTLTKSLLTLPIEESTTVEGVKARINADEGIPAGQQVIYIAKPVWWGLRSPEMIKLADDARVKEAMSLYNANRFYLTLQLRPLR